MLHVVDNLLPVELLEALQQLCLIYGELKRSHPLVRPCSAGEQRMEARAPSMPPSSDS